MSDTSLHIGTCGWKYPHWKGRFYDENLPIHNWLDFYITRFETVELTTTFYRMPREWMLENWREKTPENFRFSVKAGQSLTQIQKLIDPKHAIETFMSRVNLLGSKVGPIIFQLPPEWEFSLQRLDDFLIALPDNHRYVFEFRDRGWWNDEVYKILKRYNAAFCFFDFGGTVSPREITADFIYIRLHGPGEAHNRQYDTTVLQEWKQSILDWRKQGIEVFCYFNNDLNGYAALDAERMVKLINEPENAEV